MTDYIERDELVSYFKEIATKTLRDGSVQCVLGAGVIAHMTAEIKGFPAADVKPVVRGTWVKAKRAYCTPGGDPVWECSECGKGIHVYGIEHGSYGADVADGQWVSCPNCGAEMREENEE